MDGWRIKNLRERLGFTQQDLSDSLNVSMRSVTRWENDIEAYPDSETLLKMAKTLGTSTDFLLGLIDDPAPAHITRNGVLSLYEQKIIAAIRRNDLYEAIKMICATDGKAF